MIIELSKLIINVAISSRDALQEDMLDIDYKIKTFILYEYVFLYIHLLNRLFFAKFGETEGSKIIDKLASLIINTSVESMSTNLSIDEKDTLSKGMYKNLNEAELKYSKCKRLINPEFPFDKDSVFSCFAKHITDLINKNSDAFITTKIMSTALVGYSSIQETFNFLAVTPSQNISSLDRIEFDISPEEQINQIKRLENPILINDMLRNEPVDIIQGSSGDFGKTIQNPIPVNGIQGERTYLSYLSCQICNEPFLFHKVCSVSTNINNVALLVDQYELLCYQGCTRESLYFAPYYPKRSIFIPKGYNAKKIDLSSPIIKFFVDYPISLGTNQYLESFPFGLEKFIIFYFEEVIGNPSLAKSRLKKYQEVISNLIAKSSIKS